MMNFSTFLFDLKRKNLINRYCLDNNILAFKSEQEVEEWYENNKFKVNILKELPKSLYCYDTIEQIVFKNYCGYLFYNINLKLRYNHYEKNNEVPLFDEYINIMSKEIKDRKIQEQVMVVRWMSYNDFHNIYKTKISRLIFKEVILQDKAFLSTSLNLNYIHKEETANRIINNPILFFIKVPIGISAIYIDKSISDRNENELILDSNVVMKINKVLYFWKKAIIIADVLLGC